MDHAPSLHARLFKLPEMQTTKTRLQLSIRPHTPSSTLSSPYYIRRQSGSCPPFIRNFFSPLHPFENALKHSQLGSSIPPISMLSQTLLARHNWSIGLVSLYSSMLFSNMSHVIFSNAGWQVQVTRLVNLTDLSEACCCVLG